ncbi:uncharacterized protein PITG_02220 [Phytophthora infestans T30-4]|uniref:Uncharacterized protein n=1 Tax=Phytophthora infestans (strain T30-4) TaxID=403677 RepID=D0MVS4_PHYIT|nr:uncharacterized protein PITG_02220 [Phytophthora infestans T30-4]EEY63737.1 hypothetical protein PITG_02220 [Phytophthora infestans T30-4]|eukprot:XP_002907173.1 hypothetical protein PITG_02220 [Phytophthora infestans T30-4]
MRRRSGLSPAPIEFLPRRFYLVVIRERTTCSIHRIKDTSDAVSSSEQHLFPRTPGIRFVSLREQLFPSSPSSEYALGIPQTHRFNSFLTNILNATVKDNIAAGDGHKSAHYFFLRRRHLREEIQVAHLICRWRLLYLRMSPHEALAPFKHLSYLFSSFLSSSELFDPPSLLVSLSGISKGLEKEFLGSAEDWDEYAELEKTISALKRRKVSLVVTLGITHSDVTTFTVHGLETLDISSMASSSPTLSHGGTPTHSVQVLVDRFLEACEGTEGLIAVNASSSLGCVSAATCIGCYLMKHSAFTSEEAVGWLQFGLPGKFPLAWQLFLGRMQSQMWLEGERSRRGKEGDLLDGISDSTHINIGKISLGRLSLLGTRDRDKHRSDSFTASIPVATCLSSRSQELQQSPTAATATAQLKRRPLTQGSVGSRRYHRSTDGTSLRADFALMHKFLHQTPSSTHSESSSPSSLHPVPSRPKASARSSDGTPANCTEALA